MLRIRRPYPLLFYVFSLFIIIQSSTFAEEGPPPDFKPYTKCELLIMGIKDRASQWVHSSLHRADQGLNRVKPWKISAADEEKIAEIFSNDHLSDEQIFIQLYEVLSQARQNQLNFLSRFFVKRAARKALTHDSIYARTLGGLLKKAMGPHYNPVFNRVASTGRRGWQNNPLDTLIAFHEFEHLVHRNESPLFWITMVAVRAQEMFASIIKTPFSIPMLRMSEAQAMGAQWEFTRQIPKEVRQRMLSHREDLHFFATDEELNVIKALIFTGVLEKIESIIRKALPQDSTQQAEDEAQIQIRKTILFSLIGKDAVGDWFNAIHSYGRSRLTSEELQYLRGVHNQGLLFAPIQEKISAYLNEKAYERDSLPPSELHFYREQLSSIRYADHHALLGRMEEIFYASLEYADLPKDEFIRRMSYVHGYTIQSITRTHYSLSWRAKLLYFSLFGAVMGVDSFAFDRGLPNWWTPDLIFANDLRYLSQALLYLLGQ